MMRAWGLPRQAELDGVRYEIRTDYRDILEILRWLGGRADPEHLVVAAAVGGGHQQRATRLGGDRAQPPVVVAQDRRGLGDRQAVLR